MTDRNQETIVIVGYGWVGQANALALTKMGYHVYYYDVGTPTLKYEFPYKSTYELVTPLTNVFDQDSAKTCYIVCVGDKVSEEGVQDISAIESALHSLKNTKGTIILRSTIIPDSLNRLTFDFYVPEFLHEKKAVEECLTPHYFIVGKKTHKDEPSFFAKWREKAAKQFTGTPREAAFIKYLSNIWNSLRIAFVNEFGNTILEPDTQRNLNSIERVINFFYEGKSYLRYGKSFGGHCLPKDTRAFFHFYKSKGKNVPLIEAAYESNLKHQEVEKKFKILPEWFSEWVRPEIGGRAGLKALKSSVKRNIKKIFAADK